ncbi:MAG: hypothetical protein R2795_23665 [Saprospiraceae bacterium]
MTIAISTPNSTNLFYLFGIVLEHGGFDTKALFAHERFTTEFEEDAAVLYHSVNT